MEPADRARLAEVIAYLDLEARLENAVHAARLWKQRAKRAEESLALRRGHK
jgi:hypothetical protein